MRRDLPYRYVHHLHLPNCLRPTPHKGTLVSVKDSRCVYIIFYYHKLSVLVFSMLEYLFRRRAFINTEKPHLKMEQMLTRIRELEEALAAERKVYSLYKVSIGCAY